MTTPSAAVLADYVEALADLLDPRIPALTGYSIQRYSDDQPRDEMGKWTDGGGGSDLRVRSFDGEVGNNSHTTRIEEGTIPTSVVANMPGAKGEKPGEHRNRLGADWTAFLDSIKEKGIYEPLFIIVDHGKEPRLSEGNHRRDAAVALGLPSVPVEIKYYGHAEQQGLVTDRVARSDSRATGLAIYDLGQWERWALRRLGRVVGSDFEFDPSLSDALVALFDVDLAAASKVLVRAMRRYGEHALRAGLLRDSTIPDHRDRNTRRFSSGLAALLHAVESGAMDLHGFQAAFLALWASSRLSIQKHWATSHGIPLADLQAASAGLADAFGTKVQDQAMSWARSCTPSIQRAGHPLFLTGWEATVANSIGGGVWALDQAIEGRAAALAGQEIAIWHCLADDTSCDDCIDLDDQMWAIDAVPQFPGDGNTKCRGNCRCHLEYTVHQGLQRYSDDQPRDEQGRWTDGGGETVAVRQMRADYVAGGGALHDFGQHEASLLGLGDPSGVDNKIAVQATLTDQLINSPEFRQYVGGKMGINPTELERAQVAAVVRQFVDSWAGTSGDTNATSIAMQLAAEKEFGIKDAFTSLLMQGAEQAVGTKVVHGEVVHLTPGDVRQQLAEVSESKFGSGGAHQAAGMQAFVRAQYNATQEWFADHGITHVDLYRGVRGNAGMPPAGTDQEFQLQPVSSFSYSKGEAETFAEQWNAAGGYVMHMRVPVSRVLSTVRTGFGSTKEQEFTVLGGRVTARIDSNAAHIPFPGFH